MDLIEYKDVVLSSKEYEEIRNELKDIKIIMIEMNKRLCEDADSLKNIEKNIIQTNQEVNSSINTLNKISSSIRTRGITKGLIFGAILGAPLAISVGAPVLLGMVGTGILGALAGKIVL
jgi:t-SNARE complex subunit (syntaxin)